MIEGGISARTHPRPRGGSLVETVERLVGLQCGEGVCQLVALPGSWVGDNIPSETEVVRG